MTGLLRGGCPVSADGGGAAAAYWTSTNGCNSDPNKANLIGLETTPTSHCQVQSANRRVVCCADTDTAHVCANFVDPAPGATDLALSVTATASPGPVIGDGSSVVDGNDGTRWESAQSDPQWLELDLGSTQTLCSMQIKWENAYSTDFVIQTSATGGPSATDWTTLLTVVGQSLSNVGDPVWYAFDQGGSARYVRFYGTGRVTLEGTQYGNSFYRWGVYSTCSDGSTCDAAECSTATGYSIARETNLDLSTAGFDVTVSCATGYQGTAAAAACTAAAAYAP